MKKIILTIIISLSIIGGIYLYQAKPYPAQQIDNQAQTQSSTVKINIVFPENTVSETLDINENDTAYSVLEKVAQDNQIEMDVKQYDFGIFVQAIGDYKSDENMSWIYFVDGQSGSVAADQYKLKPDQVVDWKYVEPTVTENE